MKLLAIAGVLFFVILAVSSVSAQVWPYRVMIPAVELNAQSFPVSFPTPTATATPVPSPTVPQPSATATPSPTIAAPTPTSTPVATLSPKEIVVVYIRGYDTQYPANSGDIGFQYLANDLNNGVWQPWDYINYSYTGGSMYGGAWWPNSYGCSNTTIGIDAAYRVLESMLSQYLSVYPDAQFILVGHSFGGVVAWWHLYRERFFNGPSNSVVGVITIDSPLWGVSSGKLTGLSWFGGCLVDSNQTVADMGWLYNNSATLSPYFGQVISWARSQNIGIWTFGNQNDCWYWPNNTGCDDFGLSWSDDRYSQYFYPVDTAYSVPIDPSWGPDPNARSHDGLLQVWPYYDYIASSIAGIGSTH